MDAAGIYRCLWRPEECGIETAEQLIGPLEKGLALLYADPRAYKALEPENKWGTYDNFVPWLEALLAACRKYPHAKFKAWR
jgi:hypothetical protein